jgi:hypothetical protein
MPRHAHTVDPATRVSRFASLTFVWIGGLAAGCYVLLGVAARYGCGANQHGLACGNGGTAVGVALLIGVIAIVTSVTVLMHGRTPRRAAVIAFGGLLALGGCAFGAHALLSTI